MLLTTPPSWQLASWLFFSEADKEEKQFRRERCSDAEGRRTNGEIWGWLLQAALLFLTF